MIVLISKFAFPSIASSVFVLFSQFPQHPLIWLEIEICRAMKFTSFSFCGFRQTLIIILVVWTNENKHWAKSQFRPAKFFHLRPPLFFSCLRQSDCVSAVACLDDEKTRPKVESTKRISPKLLPQGKKSGRGVPIVSLQRRACAHLSLWVKYLLLLSIICKRMIYKCSTAWNFKNQPTSHHRIGYTATECLLSSKLSLSDNLLLSIKRCWEMCFWTVPLPEIFGIDLRIRSELANERDRLHRYFRSPPRAWR